MEILFAILLLFGGATLGPNTADNGDDAIQSTPGLPNVEGVPDPYPVTPVLRQGAPNRCPSGGTGS